MSARTAWRDVDDQPLALRRTLDGLFGERGGLLARARAAIASGPEIVLTGMGASHLATLAVRDRWLAAGRRVDCIEAGELLYGPLELCRGRTIVIVSRSGASIEVTRLLDALAPLGATTIGISNEAGSQLLNRADVPLFLDCPPDRMVAIQTYQATIAALIAIGGAERAAFEPAIEAVATTIAMAKAAKPTIGACLAPFRPIYLIARGPRLATALEGQLLLHEAARRPAVAMTGHGFRHGPQEVMDGSFAALVLTGPGPLAALDGALVRDIRAVGGTAILIGEDGDLPVAAVDETFAPLVDIVPLQIVSLKLAEALGLVAGDFRYSALVTTREDGFSL